MKSKSEASPWVRTSLLRLGATPTGIALDIPCGKGRHSRLLLEHGFCVIGADLDPHALGEVDPHFEHSQKLIAVRLDALRPLPFAPSTFDLVLIIHPHSLEVLDKAIGCLRVGGHLILETFGAQGENWRSLPRTRQVPDEMLAGYKVIKCKENPVAKAPHIVTCKGLFQKI